MVKFGSAHNTEYHKFVKKKAPSWLLKMSSIILALVAAWLTCVGACVRVCVCAPHMCIGVGLIRPNNFKRYLGRKNTCLSNDSKTKNDPSPPNFYVRFAYGYQGVIFM